MSTVNQNGGCWPTRSQQWLLRAALLRGQSAFDAWHEWKTTADLNQLDAGSRRLLPQLYHNLATQNVPDDLVEEYKEFYKHCFCENEVLFHGLSTLLSAFREAGIPTMLLKGSALIPLYYKDSGLRPMADCDLLVHPEAAQVAMSLLKNLGWRPIYHPPEKRISISHSTPFENSLGQQLDLHWHVMWECWHADDDNDFWEKAIPVQINSVSTLALNPTDQLLHVCWHGARWDGVPPIRWIADSMMIINNSQSEIDWRRLIAETRKRHLSLPIRDCLNYLRDVLEAPIPAEVFHALANVPLSANERLSYRIATDPFRSPTTVEILRSLSYDLTWLLSSTRLRIWPIVFARFLQDKWKLEHLWHIPFVLPLRGWKRLRKPS